MAGLDTSIALGIKPVDFGDPNEGRMNALRAQMMQMQMQQGQFNMMKAQRDMQYQDQQRAAAAAAAARDKAAEKEAINAFLKTAQPGSPFNPNPNTPYAPADASAEGSGMFPAWNNAQPPDMNATIQQLVNAGKFDAAKKMMGQNQAFNVNTESNLKVQKDTAGAAEAGSKAASAEIELFNKQYAPHRAALVNVTSPEEAAAWTSSMYDQPTFGDMMKKLGMSKEQATAQSAQKFAENPQAWIVSQMNLDGEKAHKLVYGEGKEEKGIPLTDAAGNVRIVSPTTAKQIGETITAGGKPSATYEKNTALKQAMKTNIDSTINELDEISKPGGLIAQSTGSRFGAAVDYMGEVVGKATQGSIASARLAPIADKVLKMVPRFEGPQSDKDVKSYEKAGGDLANPYLPVEKRIAAAKEIARLLRDRKDQFVDKDALARGDITPEPAPAVGGKPPLSSFQKD
jgi:hypothetical protein